LQNLGFAKTDRLFIADTSWSAKASMLAHITMLFSALPIHELAALAAATCWALTGMIAPVPAGHLGALHFNRLRQVFGTLVLAVLVTANGQWGALSWGVVPALVLSGMLGIFVGDSLLFAALNRLGPRRAGILFALNAPMAALLSWAWLGETLELAAVIGIGVTAFGVALAILYGNRGQVSTGLEAIKGSLSAGVALGLGAALGQALGIIIARPLMAGGLDPFAASLLRIGVSAACLSVLLQLPFDVTKPKAALTWKITAYTASVGFLGLGVGMTFLLFALSGGKAGIVSTISATTPVIILPMLWAKTGIRPAAGAWVGAGLVVVGMALLFLGR
jgi:drug/metabolite transporter (DMT)-like permease